MPAIETGLCVLATLSGQVTAEGVGWLERLQAEIEGSDGCSIVEVVLPLGVGLEELSGRVTPADGPRYRLGEERFARTESNRNGSRVYTVIVPELGEGEILRLDVTRRWLQAVDYVWRPGTARFAELKLPRGADPVLIGLQPDGRFVWAEKPDADTSARLFHPWASLDTPLPTTSEQGLTLEQARARLDVLTPVPRAFDGRDPRLGDDALARGAVDDRGYARTLLALLQGGPDSAELGHLAPEGRGPRPGDPEVVVTEAGELVHHPGLAMPAGTAHTSTGMVLPFDGHAPINRPQSSPRWTAEVSVQLPGRQPLRTLGEGREAQVCTTLEPAWGDPEVTRTLFLPVPDAARRLRAVTDASATVRASGDALYVVLPPGVTLALLSWCEPMLDAWGQLPFTPDAPPTAKVAFDDDLQPGRTEIVWDDARTWRLAWLDGQELLSSKERLAQEIQARIIAASYPEPALSRRLTGGARGADLASFLMPLLRTRAAIAPLPRLGQVEVRGLHAARRQRVLTQLEAAAILSHYARHGRIRSDWALVRTDKAHHGIAPVGFDDAVVRLAWEDEVRWIDVGCTWCGTWQVRPQLRDAELLSWGFDGRIPQPASLQPTELANGLWALVGPPPPDAGYVHVDTDDDGVHWTLEGIDAVQFLESRATPEASEWHDPSMHPAAPSRIEDLTPEHDDRVAAPAVRLTWAGGSGADPLTWRATSTQLTGWPTVRAWKRPFPELEGESADVNLACEGEGWAWRAAIDDGQLVEQLLVQRGSPPRERLAACRALLVQGALPGAAEQGLEAASP